MEDPYLGQLDRVLLGSLEERSEDFGLGDEELDPGGLDVVGELVGLANLASASTMACKVTAYRVRRICACEYAPCCYDAEHKYGIVDVIEGVDEDAVALLQACFL